MLVEVAENYEVIIKWQLEAGVLSRVIQLICSVVYNSGRYITLIEFRLVEVYSILE